MIRVIICDITSLPFMMGDDKISDRIEENEYLVGLLERTAHPMLAIERSGAYLTLADAYRLMCGERMPKIEADELGRPRFAEGNIDFNISHSGTLVGVALSDTSRVGIDVEGEIDRDRAKHIESRYTSRIRTESLDGAFTDEVEIYHARLDGEGRLADIMLVESIGRTDEGYENIEKNPNNVKHNLHFDAVVTGESVTSTWCATESALKCRGSGFAEFFDTGAHFDDDIRSRVYRLTDSSRSNIRTFYIALSQKPKG